jgi:hypothetical protein
VAVVFLPLPPMLPLMMMLLLLEARPRLLLPLLWMLSAFFVIDLFGA